MNTVFHLSSADEINEDLIKSIKATFKNKPISVTIEEDFSIPEWQKEEVGRRKEYLRNNSQSFVSESEMDDYLNDLESGD